MGVSRKLRVAKQIFEEGGPKALARRTARFVTRRTTGKREVVLPVAHQDILAADWRDLKATDKKRVDTRSLTINWVIPPASGGSGGHQNIFRFVRGLEAKGHKCRLYFYDSLFMPTLAEIKSTLDKHFPGMEAEVYNDVTTMKPCDAVFATSWQTAYPVFNFKTDAKKFYFVQDFEPYFYPVGSESVLAENTYKFGFYGITAGGWLPTKLAEYGMKAESYDFGSDSDKYRYDNGSARKEIFFYARPVTPRRGFELGVMALELFAKQHPDYVINFAGWDVSDYKLPFKFNNLRVQPLSKLNELYNRCAAGLVVSLTNMSLMPLELLSAGCIPVVNDAPNNRLVSNNKYIEYTESSPAALAEALHKTVTRPDLPKYAEEASASVAILDWQHSIDKFVEILTRQLNG